MKRGCKELLLAAYMVDNLLCQRASFLLSMTVIHNIVCKHDFVFPM